MSRLARRLPVRWPCLAATAFGGLFIASLASAAPKNIVVAVTDFQNNSGVSMSDIGPATHETIEPFLIGLPGVHVVTREKLAAVMREQAFGVSGFVGNHARSTQLGRLLGADYLVTGAVTKFVNERRPFRGYGTSTLTVIHRMRAGIEIVDLGSSELIFSKNYEVETKDFYPEESSAPYEFTGKERDLMEALVEKASDDFRSALTRSTSPLPEATTVRVQVSSKPPGADIELNGVYVGSTPSEIPMPSGIQLVRITLQGFVPWQKKVSVGSGLKIDATLAEIPPDAKIEIEEKKN